MNVQQEQDEKKARFYIEDGTNRIAVMEYTYTGEGEFTIHHTIVDEAYEGKGLGKMLVAAAVNFAREHNMKIIPRCPYARAVLTRKPEYADVLYSA